MKRAQLEFIGLAVIVLLVSLGLLLAVRFILFKKIENPKPKFDATQLSSNFLNTLTETTTTCRGMSYKELITSYFESRYVNCGRNSSEIIPNDAYLRNFTESIINDTLRSRNRQFLFDAEMQGGSATKLTYGQDTGCTTQKTSVEKFFSIPTSLRPITLKLRVCYTE
jgi:hypothetical protein